MDQLVELASGALIVVVGQAQLRAMTASRSDDRRQLFERSIGEHLRIIGDAGTQLTGLVRRVDRRSVAVRVVGAEVRMPLDQIDEVWQGRRLLARW